MAKWDMPDIGQVKKIFNRKSGNSFKPIFTKKQLIFFVLLLLILPTVAGVLTGVYRYQSNKQIEQKRAQEAALYGDTSAFSLERGRILVPFEMKGEREYQAGFYRKQRELWSAQQIRGKNGEGEWSDPAQISSDIFIEKNDLFLQELFAEVE